MIAGQTMLLFVILKWSDYFPSWLNRILVLVILISPLAYLTVFIHPSMRVALRDLALVLWALIFSIVTALIRLLHPATVVKLARFVVSLRALPATVDEWITFCVLPFKTCIVATFPMIWIVGEITSHFHKYGRNYSAAYPLVFQCYLISLLALLLGALLQAVFCHAGRATTTLRFFLLGLVLPFGLALFSRVILF